MTNSIVHKGTCFLYKKGKKVFIITNYHIRGMDPIHRIIKYDADTLYFKYPIINSNHFGVAKLKIDKNGKNSLRLFTMYENLDLYAIELNPIPKNALLYYINQYMDKSFYGKIPDSVFYYGYPIVGDITKDTFDAKQEMTRGDYQNNFDDLATVYKKKYPSELETFYKLKPILKANYFLSTPMVWHGYSGAPIFGRFIIKNKIQYKFMGVLFGYQGDLPKTYCIQPLATDQWITTNIH